jgi:hypothetical protein
MKKITIFSLLGVIVLAGVLLYWQHVKIARSDSNFRQNLAGIWLREDHNLRQGSGMPLSMRCTNTVAADGSFVELSWFGHADRTNTYRRKGTWLVKNGHLIEIIKSSTNPAEVTPHTDAGLIIRADTREFTLRWPNSEQTEWQRIIQ